ncbi:MAG: helix-turn-helix domain-containing protein [Actinobacteria bacterium]|nr:helix-turn-helix domain-containing protein [Actinomycetota bacterium]
MPASRTPEGADAVSGAAAPVPPIRPGLAAELAGVSVDTVRRWCDDGRLRTSRSSGGQRLVDTVSLAGLLLERGAGGSETSRRSARNRFLGIVTAVEVDRIAAQVELQCGPHRVVALVTREAVEELDLRPGVVAAASVKATNVVVEVVG